MGCLSHSRFLEIFRCTLAFGSILLVLGLGILAQDAALHRHLHDATATAGADDGCVVDLFGQGVSVSIALAALPPEEQEWRALPPVVAPDFFLESPRYLLQPERGPPFC